MQDNRVTLTKTLAKVKAFREKAEVKAGY